MRVWGFGIVVAVAVMLAIPKLHAPTPPVRSAVASQVQPPAKPLAVITHTVEPAPLSESVNATGSLLASETVVLQAEVAGRIAAIAFGEGSYVARGDLLVKLNDAELVAMRARAQHRRDLAVIREQRVAQLLEKGVARREEFDIASSERKVQEAELALVDAQIGKTEIRAPFDGVVGLRSVSVGAFLTAGTRIATLQRVSQLKLEFSLAEQYAARVRLGDDATFSIAGSGYRHHASVYAIDPQIDPATRTVTVRALCTNARRELLPGNFATVTLQLGTMADALLTCPRIGILIF